MSSMKMTFYITYLCGLRIPTKPGAATDYFTVWSKKRQTIFFKRIAVYYKHLDVNYGKNSDCFPSL